MSDRQLITAGIDGSAESLAAADWAAREALLRELPLHLVHAFDQPSERTHLPEIEVPFHRESGALDRAVLRLSSAHPGLGILDEQVTTPPVEALVEAAQSSSLLVLGSRGFGAFAGTLVGSVATAVTARASCPVVLVRASANPGSREPSKKPGKEPAERFGPVVLGLDLEHPCDELIEFAFVMATLHDVPLQVVHTWAVPLVPSAAATDPAASKSRLLTAALAPWRHRHPTAQVTRRLVHGLARHHLVKAATEAGLLVIGRRIPAGEHLGPTAHAAIHHARCPVAVVPHD
ncbi:universal stress protein [Streptomyces venezuelae]|uniref:universal stress protein n=1 Tax=Streptomyces venezuelae TaxID=54571 RepID=UPI0037BBBB89